MATLAYPYSVRDSANTTTDNRKTGLTPTVSNGKTLASSPATVLASTVTVVEVGAGDYVALYDAETNLDASFPVDWGAGLTNPNDRYGTLLLTREAGRVLYLPAAAAGASGGLPLNGAVTLAATQAFNNTGQTTKQPVTLNAADVTGNVPADVQTFKTQTITCAASVTVLASVGTASASTAQTGDAYARIGANGVGLTSLGDTRIANLDAAVSTRSTFAGGAVASVTAPVTAGTVTDKTGYALSPTGLDAIPITDPGGVAGQTTFPKILVALYRRHFKKATVTATALVTYADDGVTPRTTQTLSDDGVTQAQGAAT